MRTTAGLITTFSLVCHEFSSGSVVIGAANHGRARPKANFLRSWSAARSPGDSWHQYAGPHAQASGHAAWTTRHRQGPHVGRLRGAFWRLGESWPILAVSWFSVHCCGGAKQHFLFPSWLRETSSGLAWQLNVACMDEIEGILLD